MAIANKINTTAMRTNRAKVCIYLLSPFVLDLPSAEPEVDEEYPPRRRLKTRPHRETVRLFESPARKPQAPVAESNESRARLQKHGGSSMASQHRPRNYNDKTLDALELALRDVWMVLKAHDPYGDWDNNLELKRQLARTLMALADSGVTDPQELRRRTLEHFDFKPPH
jgi:hypothetical protein